MSLHGSTLQQENAEMQQLFSKKPQEWFVVSLAQQTRMNKIQATVLTINFT